MTSKNPIVNNNSSPSAMSNIPNSTTSKPDTKKSEEISFESIKPATESQILQQNYPIEKANPKPKTKI